MRLDGNIIVKCVFGQNTINDIGGKELWIGQQYNPNFRERNPVICEVIEGNEDISSGTFLVCQYHHFEPDSFYLVESTNEYGIFAIPYDESIFGWLDDNGILHPLNGNIIGIRPSEPPSLIGMPEHLISQYHNRILISESMYGFKSGSILFTYDYGTYEVVYTFKNNEYRAIKAHLSDLVGVYQ